MELKRLIIFICLISFATSARGELINPSEKLQPYDVIKIQLEALKKNNKEERNVYCLFQEEN